MIRTILNQLWNSRRQNGWIFIELVIVSYFLWTVIDPIYVLTADRTIPRGYDQKGVYVLTFSQYDRDYGKYDSLSAKPDVIKDQYLHNLRVVRQCPEIESFALAMYGSFPNYGGYNGMMIIHDTIKVHARQYSFSTLDGSNLPAVYKMQDALTGGQLKVPADCGVQKRVFISERLAHKVFGTIQVVGRVLDDTNKDFGTIAGVFKDFKECDTKQPEMLCIRTEPDIEASDYMIWAYPIVFRLKNGVDVKAFEARFRRDVVPKLSIGNIYFDQLQTLKEVSRIFAEEDGVNNQLRLQYALCGFALLCIFLGMVGTFWIRCETRRAEIGLLRSFGATRKSICRRFLTEAWLLLTVAFVIALPFLVHHVHEAGFACPTDDPNPAYWQNQTVPHFLIVTLLTYIVLLVMALIGTYIPASRSARTLPAEALRDE